MPSKIQLALGLALLVILSGCGTEKSPTTFTAAVMAPELNTEAQATLLMRGVGSDEEAGLFLTQQMKTRNDPALQFSPSTGGDSIDVKQLADDDGIFRKLDLSVTFATFSEKDLVNAGPEETLINPVKGDIYYVKKSDSNSQYEMIFEVLDEVAGRSIQIRYKVISFKALR